MKKVVIFFLALFPIIVMASSNSKVEITSFTRISDNEKNKVAELCGKVVDQKKREIVDIISDPKSKKPTPFSTISQDDGSFCQIISTYMGQAIARVGQGPSTETFLD